MSSSRNPIGLFDENVPPNFLRDSVRCLLEAYKSAWEECKSSYPWQEAHDLLGDTRRAKFESQWRQVANQHSSLKARVEANSRRNCYHTLITSGRVIMTASKVDRKDEIVRDAIFRQTYARSCQMSFLDDEASDPPPDAPLYAILIHAPSDDPSVPLFAHIVFPDQECRQYLGRIRLEDRFPALFYQADGVDVEDVQDEAHVELREDIKTQDRKNA